MFCKLDKINKKIKIKLSLCKLDKYMIIKKLKKLIIKKIKLLLSKICDNWKKTPPPVKVNW